MKKTIERIDAIDGLRAIAILGVLIFHTNFIMADGNLFLSGGFLGVDIFFVLSGYLVTLISLKELQSGKFKILSFYKKRFIRILPLFIFVLATTVIASILILNFNEMTVFKDSFMSSILFYSNFFFYNLF
jgi:peptidoglycan/LPS O-acetylase OafA/YrhL